jgi:transcription initiation factor TFIIE subunit alpha
MKLTQKIIESIISEVVGEDVLPLVDALKLNKNVSEFFISTKIKIPVDVTRNQLYRLYNNNLVSFIRKKDKKKGWYIYYWNLNLDRIKYLITDLKIKKIAFLKEKLKKEESNHFFSCENKCIRTDFEQATNFEYRCPECGSLLNQENNQLKIENIKKQINAFEKELKEKEILKEKLEQEEEKDMLSLDIKKTRKRKTKESIKKPKKTQKK